MSWSPYLILTVCVCVCGMGFPGGSDGEESICHRRDSGSIPRLGRSPGEGNGYPIVFSCLKNSMDRGAWWTTVPRHAKSWTWPMWLSIHSENVLHALEKFSGQKTGVGSHSLPQGIFQTERLNPGLLHCRWILYQLSHQGSPGHSLG